MKRSEKQTCCFCAQSVTDAEYVQIVLRAPDSDAKQTLGAHRGHLEALLHRGFYVELPEGDLYEDGV